MRNEISVDQCGVGLMGLELGSEWDRSGIGVGFEWDSSGIRVGFEWDPSGKIRVGIGLGGCGIEAGWDQRGR